MFFYYDPTFLLLIPAMILAIYAQTKVKGTYEKLSKVALKKGFTGSQLGRRLLDEAGLSNVEIEEVPGKLTDHYDPRVKKLRLSAGVSRSNSVAAAGIVAHEVGHAVQDQKAYAPLKLRNNFVPVANIGSQMAIPMFFIGLIFASPMLMDIGIIAFSFAVAFHLITLPVEFNASQRAIQLLETGGYVVGNESKQAEKVLNAAALTYVAATAMAVLNLIRLLVLRGARD